MEIIKRLLKELSCMEPCIMFLLGALIGTQVSNIGNDSIELWVGILAGCLLIAYGKYTRRDR